MNRRAWWLVGFLGVTALAVVGELVGALDGNPDTPPWTDLIVRYVPAEAAVAVFGALVAWLPVHFYLRYRRRNRKGST